MARVLGIDPGTMSFDVCGLEEGKVCFERVIDTSRLVEGPEPMMEAIEEARAALDYICHPKGKDLLNDLAPWFKSSQSPQR